MSKTAEAAFTAMQITYRFRLRDTADAELRRMARAVNFVWNYCNETQRKAVRDGRKWLSGYDLQNLTAGTSRALNLHAHTIQGVCRKYDDSRRTNKKAWLRWRGKKSLGWVPFNQGHVAFRSGVFVFRGRSYKAWVSRDLVEGQTFGAGSFNQDSRGRWYINLSVKAEPLPPAPDCPIGIDLGLKSIATLSDGTKIDNPRWRRESEEALAMAQRASKKKQARNIAARVKNQRHDFLHKASAEIAANHSLIVIGNVSSQSLVRTKLAKSVLDAGWCNFKSFLRYKAIRHGGRTIEVSERFTTQVCSDCGTLPQESPKGISDLGIREWKCGACGAVHDRDVNAARNILRAGLRTLVGGASNG